LIIEIDGVVEMELAEIKSILANMKDKLDEYRGSL
jgi:hypothetical protein